MVARIKTYSACKALIYLSLLTLCACSNELPQTVVKLHFKQPEAIISALKANFEQDIDFHVVDNSIVFRAPKKEIKKTLSLLKVLDQPPSIYTLYFQKKNTRTYSTQKKPRYIDLIEGKTTTLPINRLRHEFTVSRISESRSILNIKISVQKKEEEISKYHLQAVKYKWKKNAEHHIVLTHDKWRRTEELKLSKELMIALSK